MLNVGLPWIYFVGVGKLHPDAVMRRQIGLLLPFPLYNSHTFPVRSAPWRQPTESSLLTSKYSIRAWPVSTSHRADSAFNRRRYAIRLIATPHQLPTRINLPFKSHVSPSGPFFE